MKSYDSDAVSSSQLWSMPRFDPLSFRMRKPGGTTDRISKLENGVPDNKNADGQRGTPAGSDHHRTGHHLDHGDTDE
jgi:hypothetical protein